MFVVSLRGNYLFGYSIGQSEEKRWLFGWANVAADVWKAFGLIAVAMLWRTRRRRAALVASLAWITCLLFGVNSALGIYVQDRAELVGGREARHTTYREIERELAAIEDKLRGRGNHRSPAEIAAALAGVLARPVIVRERMRGTVGALSDNCTKIDWRTKDACELAAALREEEAAASETERLEARARNLREQITTLRDVGGSLPADPVGEFYAWLTGGFVSVRDVGFGFPLFFALLIEMVSAFGPVTIAAYAEATRGHGTDHSAIEHAMASRDAPRLAAAGYGEPVESDVVPWLAERAVPAESARGIGLHELYADYATWCGMHARRAADVAVFEDALDHARELPELTGKIRKFGKRYYGIGLVEPRSVPRRLVGEPA
jgi:hypothetical protein